MDPSEQRRVWDRRVDPLGGALLDRDARAFLRQEGSTPCLNAIAKAAGIWIEDLAGRRYMDFHGNSVHHIGYAHPRLIEALKRQLDELVFTPRRYTSLPAVELAEALVARAPVRAGKVLFAPSGSDAIEIALKLARVATGRFKTLSFWNSYHGHGFGALSLGGARRERGPRLGPLLPGAEHLPQFDCLDCPYGFPANGGTVNLSACRIACAEAVVATLRRAGDIAAVVAEPMRSTAITAPPGFWTRVREACDETGTLLIFDEIPTGLGKTGKLFASEHEEVRPDIVVLGKALGGGMVPLAAVIARGELDLAPELSVGHYTHEKNPLLAQAGLTTLKIIEDEQLPQRAAALGDHAMGRLRAASARLPIRHVRGRGLLIGVTLADGVDAEAVMYRALAHGLNLKGSGRLLVLSPPLVISEAEIDRALDILIACIAARPVT